MNAPARPTIRSLARVLRMSRTTVSEALRNNPRVNEHTRARVQRAALAHGYRFNPLASSVMSEVRRTRLAAFHGALAAINFVEPARPVFPGPYKRELLRGAGERAAELGFTLEYFNVSRTAAAIRRLDRMLRSRGIRGMLMLPAWNHPDFAHLVWANYSGVYADHMIERPALHSVCADHHRAMMEMMAHLHTLGYRRPGLVLQHHHDDRIQHRWSAAFLAYRQFHSGVGAVPLFVAPEITAASFGRWFCAEKPDVVLGHRAELVAWMEENGARVPATHGFCCLNISLNTIPCAGLDQQPAHIGARAIELVIAQLHRNEYGIPDLPCNTTVPCRWVDGPTLRVATPAESGAIARRR